MSILLVSDVVCFSALQFVFLLRILQVNSSRTLPRYLDDLLWGCGLWKSPSAREHRTGKYYEDNLRVGCRFTLQWILFDGKILKLALNTNLKKILNPRFICKVFIFRLCLDSFVYKQMVFFKMKNIYTYICTSLNVNTCFYNILIW